MCGCITAFSRVSLAGMLSFLLLSIFLWHYRKMRRKEEHLRVCLISYFFFELEKQERKRRHQGKRETKKRKQRTSASFPLTLASKKKKLEK